MARQGDLERYEEWRSTFNLDEEGPHTFRQLDKLLRIDNIVWNGDEDSDEKIGLISSILTNE